MGDVTKLPSRDRLEQMKGPDLYGCAVVVDGHEVPNLWLVDNGGDTVEICFPGPVHFIFPRDQAPGALELAAKAMAIGAGHGCISSEHAVTKSYGPKVHVVTFSEK